MNSSKNSYSLDHVICSWQPSPLCRRCLGQSPCMITSWPNNNRTADVMHIISSEAGVGSWQATYTTTLHIQSFSLQKVSGQLECVYLSCPAALLPLLCLCYTTSFLSSLLLVQIDRSDSCPSSSRSPSRPPFPFCNAGRPANSHPIHPSSCSCLLQQ